MRYRIFHLVVDSILPLPELPRIADTSRPDTAITFRISRTTFITAPEPQWFHRWFGDEEKNEVAIEVARRDQGYLLRFPGLAVFKLDLESGRIDCFPLPDTPTETIRHLLLDQVIPRLLAHQGHLLIHASAVVTNDGFGLVFLGKSGWGKSTVASSFHQQGARLLSDDSLLLLEEAGKLVGVPAYAGSRLWCDSAESVFPGRADFSRVAHYSEKKRLILHARDDDVRKHEVHAIFLISDPAQPLSSAEIQIIRVGGAEGIMTLIKRTFLLDVECMAAVARQFNSASKIATTSPAVYSLAYPRQFERLPALRTAIRQLLDAQLPAARIAAS